MPRARRYPPGEPPPPEGGLLQLIQPDPLLWLYAIDVPSTPNASKARFAAYHETVYFERDSLGAAVAYAPGSLGHDAAQGDTEGSVPKVKLAMQNLTREAIALLEAYRGLTGQKVRIVQVRLSDTVADPGTVVPIIDETYEVLDARCTEVAAELTLGRAALQAKKFPDRRAQRLYCAHDYGGPGCGYDTTRSGALQTCTKLELGANGCTAHGDDEVAALLARKHPARILAFKGIPRTSGVGVS